MYGTGYFPLYLLFPQSATSNDLDLPLQLYRKYQMNVNYDMQIVHVLNPGPSDVIVQYIPQPLLFDLFYTSIVAKVTDTSRQVCKNSYNWYYILHIE